MAHRLQMVANLQAWTMGSPAAVGLVSLVVLAHLPLALAWARAPARTQALVVPQLVLTTAVCSVELPGPYLPVATAAGGAAVREKQLQLRPCLPRGALNELLSWQESGATGGGPSEWMSGPLRVVPSS